MAVWVGFIEKRANILQKVTEANDYVASHCYFCRNCYKCKLIAGFKHEIETKGFKKFNLDKQW